MSSRKPRLLHTLQDAWELLAAPHLLLPAEAIRRSLAPLQQPTSSQQLCLLLQRQFNVQMFEAAAHTHGIYTICKH